MIHAIRFWPAMLLALAMIPVANAQNSAPIRATSPAANRKTRNVNAAAGLEQQMLQMRKELQAQIDDLRQQLAERDVRLAKVQQAVQTVQQQTVVATTETQSASESAQKDKAALSALELKVDAVQASNTAVVKNVSQVQTQQQAMRKEVEEPAALHYKGITLVPGGYLAGESVWRQRAMNADIYTNFNATPYMNSAEAHISEWVPSARQSRLSFLASGNVPFGTISGYFEGDFLSAGTTSNNLQSNSYTMRVRQAWAQAAVGRTTVTGGQMWSLMTENKKAAQPGQEAVPLFFDANLHVGFTYTRQLGFRVQEAFTPRFTMALALENSQYQFSASNAPTNFFFGGPGAAGGLNNLEANYTNQVAPDVILKASFDPGYGHYEVGGIVRFFRDRYYPTTGSATGARNDTEVGGGFVANARFPVTPKASLGLHLVAGDGTGRYGASILPDITVHPNGTLEPLRNVQGLLSVEAHPNSKWDIFGYFGTEYLQRTYYANTTGTLVGYGVPGASNTGCNTEAVPTAGTGYAPGATACLGATRDLLQGSAGWLYRVYSGPKGKLQYGLAYSYLTRNGWTAVGGSPKATNNLVYTSFRYYLP